VPARHVTAGMFSTTHGLMTPGSYQAGKRCLSDAAAVLANRVPS
jgi:hypothetical protein